MSLDMKDNLRANKEKSMVLACPRSRKENLRLTLQKKVEKSEPVQT